MADALFRNEVIEAGRNRLTGTVIAAVPPSSRVYTRIAAAVAALLVLLLVLGSYTMTSDVRGLVSYDAGVARVYPHNVGDVAAIHVKQGDRVTAGQPLVTLAIAQGQNGLAPQLTQVANQDSELGRQLDLAAAQSSKDVATLEQQHAGYVAGIASLQRQRAIAQDQIALAQAALQRAQRLAEQGAGTQRQVEDSRSTLLARRAEYESLGEQMIAQQTAMRANEQDQAKRRVEGEVALSQLQAQRAQLAQQQAELTRTDRLTLTSPVDGTVGDIALEIGQQASPERSVVSVIPADSKLEIWLYAPTRAVGRAHPGQKVRLQFDAFPFQKYGSGVGVVTAVARVPTEPGGLDPGLQITEPVFRIRARIDSLSPGTKIPLDALRPGMTLSAKLELERRSLWQLLLGPIFETLGK